MCGSAAIHFGTPHSNSLILRSGDGPNILQGGRPNPAALDGPRRLDFANPFRESAIR